MKTSKNGIELIKKFEGFRSKAYKCLASELYYTIGYGHYGITDKNATITKDAAEQLLVDDLVKFEANVNNINTIGHYNFNQNEFDALVSFAYNIGSINGLTNSGKRSRADIRKYMLQYDHAGGKQIEGLTKRRKAELELFNTPIGNDYNESTTIGELVDDIIAGKLGNNDKRKDNIYNIVQGLVNIRLSK